MSLSSDLAEFCRACGKSEPVRFTVSNSHGADPLADFIWLMERPFAIVGRGEGCDVRLDHPDVSRRHAYLQMLGGRLYCCDLGSRSGTSVTGHGFIRGWVGSDQPVRIGPYDLRLSPNEFRDEASSDAASFHRATEIDELAQAHAARHVLNCVNARSNSRGGPKVRRLRDRVTLIGSHETCNLRLHHASVSRAHCSIVLTPRGIWVIDLSMKSKTLVNGVPVAFSMLQEGDELHVGDFRLVVDREPVRPPMPGELIAGKSENIIPMRDASREISISSPSSMQASGTTSEQSQLLLTIVNQFTAAQRDLFENTRQMMATMAETFNAAHQRQMDLIRDELVRVHDLNRELQQLQRELLLRQHRLPAGRAGFADENIPSPAAAVGDAELHRAMAPGVMGPSTAFPGSSDAANATETRPESTAAPNQSINATESPATTQSPAEDGSPIAGKSSASAAAGLEGSAGTPAPADVPEAPSGSPAVEEHDLHGWLNDRITKLEQERTGRWQRIMQILSRSG